MPPARRPHGRDEIVPAIQAAAIALLAEHGPREVTVREIADRARVNHALVHRHFGTKDELIRSVLTAESRAIADAAASGPRSTAAMLELLEDHRAYFRALARAVLDAPGDLAGTPLPAGEAFLRLVGGAREPDRAGAAAAGSLALGWLVFGDHLARVLGSESADELRPGVVDAIDRLTTPSRSRSRSRG